MEKKTHICGDDVIKAIVSTAQGDMRRGINNLQSIISLHGDEKINSEQIFELVDQPHPIQITKLLNAIINHDIKTSLQILTTLWETGYSANDIITTLQHIIKTNVSQDHIKIKFIKVCEKHDNYKYLFIFFCRKF